MYAWSTFHTEVDEWGRPQKTIEPGDEVSAKDLGVTDEEFEALVEQGVVREEEYPPVNPGQSPAEYEREQAYATAIAGELTPEQLEAAQEMEIPESEPEPEAKPKTEPQAKEGKKLGP